MTRVRRPVRVADSSVQTPGKTRWLRPPGRKVSGPGDRRCAAGPLRAGPRE
jgi:hypothetical protein